MGLLDEISTLWNGAGQNQPGSADDLGWVGNAANSLLGDSETDLLGHPWSPKQTAWKGMSSVLGKVAAAMGDLAGQSGHKVGIGEALGKAFGVAGQAAGDYRDQRMNTYAKRLQLAKLKQEFDLGQMDLESYNDMRNQILGALGGTAPAADGSGAAPDAAGGAPGAGGGAGAPAGADASQGPSGGPGGASPAGQDMVTLSNGQTLPRQLALAIVRAPRADGRKMYDAYITKIAGADHWIDLPADQMTPAMKLEGGVWQINTMTGEKKRTGQMAKISNSFSPSVKVDMATNEAYGKAVLGETGVGGEISAMNKRGNDANSLLANVKIFDDAAGAYVAAGGEGGTFAKVRDVFDQATGAILGMDKDTTSRLKAADVMDRTTSKMAMDILGGKLGAGVSNADMTTVKGTVANETHTNSGRAAIVGITRALAKRDQLMAQEWRSGKYDIRKPEEAIRFQNWMAEYGNTHPIAPEIEANTPAWGKVPDVASDGGGAAAPAAPAAEPDPGPQSGPGSYGQPIQVPSAAEAFKQKPGTWVQLPGKPVQQVRKRTNG